MIVNRCASQPTPALLTDDDNEEATIAQTTDKTTASSTARLERQGQLKLADVPLGFAVDDPNVEMCSKVLRLLYIEDLKDLQSEINNLIESLQKFTSGAAVDPTLGCHGR